MATTATPQNPPAPDPAAMEGKPEVKKLGWFASALKWLGTISRGTISVIVILFAIYVLVKAWGVQAFLTLLLIPAAIYGDPIRTRLQAPIEQGLRRTSLSRGQVGRLSDRLHGDTWATGVLGLMLIIGLVATVLLSTSMFSGNEGTGLSMAFSYVIATVAVVLVTIRPAASAQEILATVLALAGGWWLIELINGQEGYSLPFTLFPDWLMWVVTGLVLVALLVLTHHLVRRLIKRRQARQVTFEARQEELRQRQELREAQEATHRERLHELDGRPFDEHRLAAERQLLEEFEQLARQRHAENLQDAVDTETYRREELAERISERTPVVLVLLVTGSILVAFGNWVYPWSVVDANTPLNDTPVWVFIRQLLYLGILGLVFLRVVWPFSQATYRLNQAERALRDYQAEQQEREEAEEARDAARAEEEARIREAQAAADASVAEAQRKLERLKLRGMTPVEQVLYVLYQRERSGSEIFGKKSGFSPKLAPIDIVGAATDDVTTITVADFAYIGVTPDAYQTYAKEQLMKELQKAHQLASLTKSLGGAVIWNDQRLHELGISRDLLKRHTINPGDIT